MQRLIFKVVEQNSTLGRYITESQRWWKLIWRAFGNGFGRCKDERKLQVVFDVHLTLQRRDIVALCIVSKELIKVKRWHIQFSGYAFFTNQEQGWHHDNSSLTDVSVDELPWFFISPNSSRIHAKY